MSLVNKMPFILINIVQRGFQISSPEFMTIIMDTAEERQGFY